MRKHHLICLVAAGMVLGPLGCAREPEAPKEPVKSEEEIRQEQEAARRQEQGAALADRATRLSTAASGLGTRLEALESGLPERLESTVSAVSAERAEAESLLSELQQASGDGWETARSALEDALASLEQANAKASEALAEWESREQAALSARAEGGSPIDAGTGLIEGLDGGEYEQYLESVIVKVQKHLRRQGLYTGPADGVFDRPSLEAIGRYQEAHGLQVSGVPSPMTRSKLFEVSGAGG